ncbi:MAG: DUF885 family protein [Congregibacter sp.]
MLLLLGAAAHSSPRAEKLISEYIDAWRSFYPSQAFGYGDVASAASFEDFSSERVSNWLALNAAYAPQASTLMSDKASRAFATDLAVLLAQTKDELAKWREDKPLAQQPQWYAEQVSQALTHLLVREQLTDKARSAAAIGRLQGVTRLCRAALMALKGGNAIRTARAVRTLAATRAFYDDGLRALVADWPVAPGDQSFSDGIDTAVQAIAALEAHLVDRILPTAPNAAAIGVDIYAAKLARRTSGLYTPEKLLLAAGNEMREARMLMHEEAARWRDSQAAVGENAATNTVAAPSYVDDGQLLAAAIEAMEHDRQDNSADFLESFTELTFAAEEFVREGGLATVPEPTTLFVALSPAYFSGAAVGGVYPSGPFAPQADTLFYIPSISDDATAKAKEGFYRSFNTHFNTMILSHEMFPGHYLQYKVAVTQAPMLRSLFANGAYVEGWGSFVEELMLNAGWADNAPLTRLAHLRKRLENATRAYVSVQVNTAAWGEEQVLSFARDEGLLAPQFATNLWQRVVNSPLQITDYLTGYLEFRRLYAGYRAMPENLGTRPWVDAVLQAGPLPMALLESEL